MKELIRSFSPPPGRMPMYASMAGISYCDGSYRIIRPKSKVTVMEYIRKGKGYLFINGTWVPVMKDSVYILPGGMDQDYRSDAADPWEKLFVNMEGDLPVTLLREYGLTDQHIFPGEGLEELFQKVPEVLAGSQSDEQAQGLMAAMFTEVVTRLGISAVRSSLSPEAAELRDYITANTDRILSNQELAARIYRSPDYCVKLFNREFGTTPYQYQLNEKMRIARRLLRSTMLPVSEIAAMLGYRDISYFSALFREKNGISPVKYRKR